MSILLHSQLSTNPIRAWSKTSIHTTKAYGRDLATEARRIPRGFRWSNNHSKIGSWWDDCWSSNVKQGFKEAYKDSDGECHVKIDPWTLGRPWSMNLDPWTLGPSSTMHQRSSVIVGPHKFRTPAAPIVATMPLFTSHIRKMGQKDITAYTLHTCTHVCIHIYIYMYTHIHTYIYIYILEWIELVGGSKRKKISLIDGSMIFLVKPQASRLSHQHHSHHLQAGHPKCTGLFGVHRRMGQKYSLKHGIQQKWGVHQANCFEPLKCDIYVHLCVYTQYITVYIISLRIFKDL